jgi:hypothetical protein
MSSNFTITLSLGSGPKGEALARRIKAWAGSRPVSEVIRNLILDEMDNPTAIGQKAFSSEPE